MIKNLIITLLVLPYLLLGLKVERINESEKYFKNCAVKKTGETNFRLVDYGPYVLPRFNKQDISEIVCGENTFIIGTSPPPSNAINISFSTIKTVTYFFGINVGESDGFSSMGWTYEN